MRLDDYVWVFDGWHPEGLHGTGFCLASHLGVPFVEFHLWTDQGCASVRCDPCTDDGDKIAYAAMVRIDLAKAIARLAP